jgi:AcrR family transcriptional regulator
MTGREKLLESASALFSQDRYPNVSVAQILERAELQPPTLYYHFNDKEGLFVEWAKHAFGALGATLKENLRPHLGAEESLAAFARTLLQRPSFDFRSVLQDTARLARDTSREAILNAYLTHLFEPACDVMANINHRQVARQAELMLASLLALQGDLRTGESVEDVSLWWARNLLHGIA